MFAVIFEDEIHGMQETKFNDFDEAVEYWNWYADTPTCKTGKLQDLETDEIIWEF